MAAPKTALLILAGPAGVGKSTLCDRLVREVPGFERVVTATTRPPRPNEQHGREYYFVSNDEFDRMVADGAFLEHARVFDNQYGTSLGQLREKLATGADVILEIDWQGARQVRAALPEARSIFILPPSLDTLRSRLNGRQTDSPEVIARRLADAVGDMAHYREFDFTVVNENFDQAVSELEKIVSGQGETLKSERPELSPLTRNLLDFPTL